MYSFFFADSKVKQKGTMYRHLIALIDAAVQPESFVAAAVSLCHHLASYVQNERRLAGLE